MTVRDYAILYVGGKRTRGGTVVGGGSIVEGGNGVLDTQQHTLDGLEHSSATGTTRLLATTAHSGLLPPLSGNISDALLGDGTWGIFGGGAGTVVSGALSNPPTEIEVETLIGAPSSSPGVPHLIEDSGNGRRYVAIADGFVFHVIPTVRLVGASATATTITASPSGGWTQIGPHATQYNGYVYASYTNGTTGAVHVVAHEIATGTSTIATALRTFTANTHTAPAILVRDSDKKLVVAYSDHSGTQMYVRISTNSLTSDPTLSGGWASEQTLDATLGGNQYTYPILHQLLGETSDPIYLFYRDDRSGGTHGVLCFSRSLDGGATWEVQTEVWNLPTKLPYWQIDSDGQTRIDFLITDGSPPAAETPVKTYHFYYDGAYRTTSGTAMTTPPFDDTDATLVYDGSDGDAWPFDVTLDGSGRPVGLLGITGVADNEWEYLAWDGAAWQRNNITNSGGILEGLAAAGLTFDHAAPGAVYLSKKVSGRWEIQKWVTLDSGASFSSANVTTGSSDDNIHVQAIRNHTAALKVVWLYGTYTDYLNTALGIKASGL